ncbi:hypothetical protein D779_3162 [Imhoffiella purpurea]|uniref:Uncharacterized protein n=1 Tax=Imhoffiella purpurea TaxID=1249627 RepID=W9VD40_9GAMM|nr:hypothetical protein D779_3162 [Imhoffiella purpurea]
MRHDELLPRRFLCVVVDGQWLPRPESGRRSRGRCRPERSERWAGSLVVERPGGGGQWRLCSTSSSREATASGFRDELQGVGAHGRARSISQERVRGGVGGCEAPSRARRAVRGTTSAQPERFRRTFAPGWPDDGVSRSVQGP